jgi:hypothetical protein
VICLSSEIAMGGADVIKLIADNDFYLLESCILTCFEEHRTRSI